MDAENENRSVETVRSGDSAPGAVAGLVVLGGLCLAAATGMLWSSKVGKLRARCTDRRTPGTGGYTGRAQVEALSSYCTSQEFVADATVMVEKTHHLARIARHNCSDCFRVDTHAVVALPLGTTSYR
jgi:hypothetical protein